MGTPDIVQAEASPYARHIPALDGIRGLAVLGVAASHLFPGSAKSLLTRAMSNTLVFGATGVDLFFVLSGFLITGILYDSRSDSKFFRKFYARRVLRIFPLYYAVLAVFVVIGIVRGLSSQGELLSLSLYLQNTTIFAPIINDYNGPLMLPLTHFWSLAIEEQFYLVWPFVVYFTRKRSHLLSFCVASFLLCPVYRFVLALHGAGIFGVQTNTAARADSLLAGAALALLLRSRFHDTTLRIAKRLFYVAGSVVLVGLVLNPTGVNHPETLPTWGFALRYTVLDAACVGMIAWVLASALPNRIFSIRVLRHLGKYSYGLYVLHLILFTYLQAPLKKIVENYVSTSKGLGVLLVGLISFAISLLAAYLSYQVYEKRFLRLKRFFDYRKHPNTAVAGN